MRKTTLHKKRVYVRQLPEDGPHDATKQVLEVIGTDDHGHTTKLHMVVSRINIVRPICDILAGENHAPHTRFAVGFATMLVGVGIAKSCGHLSNAILAHLGDLFGYSVHGLGLMPFLEHIMHKVKEHEVKAEPLRSEVQRE